jgi:hypothetical protein
MISEGRLSEDKVLSYRIAIAAAYKPRSFRFDRAGFQFEISGTELQNQVTADVAWICVCCRWFSLRDPSVIYDTCRK